jgi:aspartyl-tRNA(Asn)/glutamyl-tRNA(Gln) amidotransferase subunit A
VKPTYGRVSRYGLVAFGSSLDCVSVFGRTVSDAQRVLAAIAGLDPLDATTVDQPPPETLPVPASFAGRTIGLPREYFPADLHPGVKAGCAAAIARMKALGAAIVDVSLPHARFAVPTYYILAPAEAAANLARFDGARYGTRVTTDGDVRAMYRATRGRGFGAEVRRRILIGTYVLSAGYHDAYYHRAQAVRARIAEDFARVFASGVDFLFTPTTPTPAFKAGEKTADPVAMYLADVFVCSANLAGLPAVSIPVGRWEGLPVGGQFMARHFQEAGMLACAATLERHLDGLQELTP